MMLTIRSQRHVSIPEAGFYLILIQISEHVIIPRTENTIKCMATAFNSRTLLILIRYQLGIG